MAYENGAIYWISPVGNPNVALSVYGNSQVSQNRNVILYTKQDIADQLWRVDSEGNFARIKTTLDESYALNIYLTNNNCDIHTWSDNLEDSKVRLCTIDSTNNIYRLQNFRHNTSNNLYLTAGSATSGAQVTWAAMNNDNNLQQWKLVKKSSGGGLSLRCPVAYTSIRQEFKGEHRGVDFEAGEGTPIYAATRGRVIRIYSWQGSQDSQKVDSIGNAVFLEHFDTSGNTCGMTCYYHLREAPFTLIAEKQIVEEGKLIGYVGNTGNSTGPHLHFEVKIGSSFDNSTVVTLYHSGTWVNPMDYITH